MPKKQTSKNTQVGVKKYSVINFHESLRDFIGVTLCTSIR